MHIVFDVDGVLADFHIAYEKVLLSLYPDLPLVPGGVKKAWHWSEWVDGLTKEMEDKAWVAIFEDPKYRDFWKDLPPLATPDDILRINRLSRTNIVSFLTNRSAEGQHAKVAGATQIWLDIHSFRTHANVFLAAAGKKGERARLLGGHLAIEDNGGNCIDFLESGIGVCMLRRAYNEGFVELVRARGGYIVDTLTEFLDLCFRFDAQQEDALAMQQTIRGYTHLWNGHTADPEPEPTNEPARA